MPCPLSYDDLSMIYKLRKKGPQRFLVWLKTMGVTFAFIIAARNSHSKARADEPIWNQDGVYGGHTTDNGSYHSIWGVDGAYKGHIDKEWVNPYVPNIDRGKN